MKLTAIGVNNVKLKEIKSIPGMYLKQLPIAEMRIFDVSDAEDWETQINLIFDKLVRDKNGKKFDEFKKAKACDVLDVETVNKVVEAIGKELIPNPK